MMLYHGTNIDIQSIDLASCRPYKDFGRGFYTTDLLEQAQKMAKRVSRIYGGNPIVNLYEIDDNYMKNKELKIINFGTIPSEKWAVFVMNNRNRTFIDFKSLDCNFDYKYDIVVGPIADDDMAILFRQYQNNLISLQALLNGMTYQKTTSQYSFHTEKAVSLLKKVGVLQ
ncbi:DUF3990 domain-containing protein [Acetatifactor muris]|uniref:DUF3990 domain-containing protein n=1 Tax=Acetatifactor muris TaxID=879566 RepID=A0A2K4ZC15_9FIRM|nr:DUF3990 domain-containing protein [Acetatifactor muris]MCR2046426.1 DUF3990 domain-containing protein [Acetatifactor muris]SOY28005.1 hypothetical protein AMURIS_00710 [Acetatifactor muris]